MDQKNGNFSLSSWPSSPCNFSSLLRLDPSLFLFQRLPTLFSTLHQALPSISSP
ncbi:hypothetical protein CCACVL1_29315 [Corchorus capsularis]|uniref:Uncharacterized protein n=1 Tax=Corchorus capsularis TaxID=210143 RepID=A0A1R3G278_COCAP|nr:hypothetical protein CCACVL1_29315 [Corchorus capsularis]